MMEFTTPPSYGSQVVNVGAIYKNDTFLIGTTKGTCEHTSSEFDPVTQWDKPTGIKAIWAGKSQDAKETEAVLDVTDAKSIDLVDIMSEVPAIVKKLVAGAVGTRPFLYQVRCS